MEKFGTCPVKNAYWEYSGLDNMFGYQPYKMECGKYLNPRTHKYNKIAKTLGNDMKQEMNDLLELYRKELDKTQKDLENVESGMLPYMKKYTSLRDAKETLKYKIYRLKLKMGHDGEDE